MNLIGICPLSGRSEEADRTDRTALCPSLRPSSDAGVAARTSARPGLVDARHDPVRHERAVLAPSLPVPTRAPARHTLLVQRNNE